MLMKEIKMIGKDRYFIIRLCSPAAELFITMMQLNIYINISTKLSTKIISNKMAI